MTDKRYGSTRRMGVRAALALGLGLAGLLGVQPPPSRAATIKAHRYNYNAPATHALKNDLASLQKLFQSWRAQAEASKPLAYLKGLSLTNTDGTPRSHAFARLLRWEQAHHIALPGAVPAKVAPLANQQSQVSAQNHASQVAATISTPPKSSAFMVLIPPTTAGGTPSTGAVTVEASAPASATPVLAQQEMPVPEPSPVVTTLALLGLAGGWWRLRGASPRGS